MGGGFCVYYEVLNIMKTPCKSSFELPVVVCRSQGEVCRGVGGSSRLAG